MDWFLLLQINFCTTNWDDAQYAGHTYEINYDYRGDARPKEQEDDN